jgi:signal transduction histidine kinase
MTASLEELLAEQAALRRVATLVAGNPRPADVFQCVCAEIGGVLGVQSTNLTRFEADGTQTIVAGWSVNEAPVFPLGSGVPVEGGAAVAKVCDTGRPARVDDYSGVTGSLAVRIREAGIASSVAAPIKLTGRLWGAVVASSGKPWSFPPETEERVAGFAELVADALANADAREQLAASRARIVAAGDAERQRLERNLHDGAQQRLLSLALVLREAESMLDKDAFEARELMALAREELVRALDELRTLARGIHPAILSHRGLGAALEALVARAPTGVRITALPLERLPEPVEVAAYYVVAEALANIAKHANASRATVSVVRHPEHARVVVADDGVGGAAIATGSGLRGLADRVEALGGRLEIDSPPGAGTRLVGEIPIACTLPAYG